MGLAYPSEECVGEEDSTVVGGGGGGTCGTQSAVPEMGEKLPKLGGLFDPSILGRLIGNGLVKPSPMSSPAAVVTPDISVRKLLRQGAEVGAEGEGMRSDGGEMVRDELLECLGLPRSLSPESWDTSPPARESDFLFLLRRKLPLSNIFSQLGSSVQ